MHQIGIANIAKNPSILDKIDDVIEIVNKKTKKVKGIFIPIAYKSMISDALEEIEYQNFLKKNSSLIKNSNDDTDSLLDGLTDEY